jgi:hypothetical protein
MDSTTGELLLVTNPGKEMQINIKVVFEFVVNGKTRHSEVQFIAPLFKN